MLCKRQSENSLKNKKSCVRVNFWVELCKMQLHFEARSSSSSMPQLEVIGMLNGEVLDEEDFGFLDDKLLFNFFKVGTNLLVDSLQRALKCC